MLEKVEAKSIAPPASTVVPGRHLAIELAETLKLAVPIALTQLGQIAMMTTDIAMIGRLGAEAVAAASLAHTCLLSTSPSALAWCPPLRRWPRRPSVDRTPRLSGARCA